jgi:hypothetical protein
VTDRLQSETDSVLARTLSTPLTLSLARSAYAAGDPTELLLAADLNSEAALRGHLLDQILITAYPHPGEGARAGNWLGQMNTQPIAATPPPRTGTNAADRARWYRSQGAPLDLTRIYQLSCSRDGPRKHVTGVV